MFTFAFLAFLSLCSSAAAAQTHGRAVLFVRHTERTRQDIRDALLRRSDPNHRDFLKWLPRTEVEKLMAPDEVHLQKALNLAERHGATSVEVLGMGDKIEVSFGNGRDVPELFLHEARNMQGDALDMIAYTRRKSDSDNNLPFKIQNPLRSTHLPIGGDHQGDSIGEGRGAENPQTCLAAMDGITPDCIRKAYGLDETNTVFHSRDMPATAGQAFIVNQPFHPSDLAQFQKLYNLAKNPVSTIVGPNTGSAGDEASLDSQYITACATPNTPTTFVWLDGKMTNPFSDWLVWAAKTEDAELPRVHSLSLGAPEDEVGDQIIARMNTEMAALGLRGVTVVFASGDSGYQPVQKFGAASPYVLSVGGVFNGELRDSPLQADSLTTGGFASSKLNSLGNATWQAAALASYERNRNPKSLPSTIPVGQRAVPDLSAYDDFINIVQNGQSTSVSGTSAAAPIVSGMLAGINAAIAGDALSANTTLGFVNQFIYSHANLFLDIQKGDNRGIWAVKGYDPISGVGTFGPSTYNDLKKAALVAARRAQGNF